MARGHRNRRSYRILPGAWRSWERFTVPVGLPEAIDALLALPEGQREERRVIRPPAVFTDLRGRVFGYGLLLRGVQDALDRWLEIHYVVPED